MKETDLNSYSFGPELEVHVHSIFGQESLPPAIFFHRSTLSLVNRSHASAASPIALKFGSFCWGRSIDVNCQASASNWILIQVFPAPNSEQFKCDASKQKIQCGLTLSGAQSLNISRHGAVVSLLLRSLSREEIVPAESLTVDITISKPSQSPSSGNSRQAPNPSSTYCSLPGERSLLRIARERLAGVAASPGMVALASYGGQRWTLTVRELVPGATRSAAAEAPGKSPTAGADAAVIRNVRAV
jgi:hypothetical protein